MTLTVFAIIFDACNNGNFQDNEEQKGSIFSVKQHRKTDNKGIEKEKYSARQQINGEFEQTPKKLK